MNKKLIDLAKKNFLFWLSRKINYPLVPPDVVQVNFTFLCNLRCKMCSMFSQMELLRNNGRQIEIESGTFRKVITGAKELGAQAVLFIGGEPLLRKDLFELISYAKSLGLGSVIVTNGVLLNEENIKKCFASGVDWLSISIDAANEEKFCRIRGENILGRIRENIKNLNDLKRRAKREFPKIVSVCTIMDDNIEELLDVVLLCKQLEIERIMFQPVVLNNVDQTERGNSKFSGLIPAERIALLNDNVEKLINYKKKSLDNFNFIANNIKYLQLIKRYFSGRLKPWDLPCYAGYNRVQIVQEGKLYFCVNQKKYDSSFGDVAVDSLKDLWYSKKAEFYRGLIRGCKTPCLQWCSYRDGFIEFSDLFQRKMLFPKNGNKK